MTVLLALAAPAVAFPVAVLGGGALIGLFVLARRALGFDPGAR